MKTSDFDYFLPPEQIAQTPVEPRHHSRLMVMNRKDGSLTHRHFYHLGDYLQEGDTLVINDTKVIPARIFARKETGGKVEILLLHKHEDGAWEALVGGKRVTKGKILQVEKGPRIEILETMEGSRRKIRFFDGEIEPYLEEYGQMPLPPYIHTPLQDRDRYQTIYAAHRGSAAAPTAGLHFTPELLKDLHERGIQFAKVTLHVGLDTFAPVHEEDPSEHVIHSEWCQVDETAAEQINQSKRVVAVGTTSVRTLETAALQARIGERVAPYCGPTRLFILPGFQFRVVDALVTNFHLPRSTLLMLVSAFAGRERVLDAYRIAIESGYRFYSFGDAMLIL